MRLKTRSGVTLIELLLFIAVTALVVWVSIPLMVSTGTSQVRQEALSLLERTGSQVLQTVGQSVRGAERLWDVPAGQANTVLALQMRTAAEDPTIFGLSGTTLLYARGVDKRKLTPPGVTVTDFVVRNTSGVGSRTGVYLRFTLRYNLPLLNSGSYVRTYDTSYTFFPDDVLAQKTCSCAAPNCTAQNVYRWNTCSTVTPSVCVPVDDELTCAP